MAHALPLTLLEAVARAVAVLAVLARTVLLAEQISEAAAAVAAKRSQVALAAPA